MARRGRRPGRSGTREAILGAARRGFADHGYEGTTIRGVAKSAGVDPALVGHYFGSKDALFAAALDLPRSPAAALEAALGGPDGELGERIASAFLSVWDAGEGDPLVALLRSAGSSERAAGVLRELANTELVPRIAERIGGRGAYLRASLIVAHLLGVATARYLLRLEPVASAPAGRLAGALGPALQAHVEFNP